MDKGRDWEVATIWEIRDMKTAPTPSHYSWKLETKLTFELMMQIFYIRIGHALKAGKFSNIFKHLKLIISYWIWCFVFLSGKYCVFLYSLCRIVFLGVSKLLWKKQDVIAQELWIKRVFLYNIDNETFSISLSVSYTLFDPTKGKCYATKFTDSNWTI